MTVNFVICDFVAGADRGATASLPINLSLSEKNFWPASGAHRLSVRPTEPYAAPSVGDRLQSDDGLSARNSGRADTNRFVRPVTACDRIDVECLLRTDYIIPAFSVIISPTTVASDSRQISPGHNTQVFWWRSS